MNHVYGGLNSAVLTMILSLDRSSWVASTKYSDVPWCEIRFNLRTFI